MKSLYIDIRACVSKFLHVFFPKFKIVSGNFRACHKFSKNTVPKTVWSLA